MLIILITGMDKSSVFVSDLKKKLNVMSCDIMSHSYMSHHCTIDDLTREMKE